MSQPKRVAIVTGSGQGLGRAIALALDAAGLTVVAAGRTLCKLNDTIGLMSGSGIAIEADLSDPEQIRSLFRTTHERLGSVDVLINAAAEYAPFEFASATDDQIVNMVTQSLIAPAICMREAINWMRRSGGGDIVNISTQSAELPQPYMVLYGAAKAGLETLSQGLRFELKGEAFRIIVCQVGVIAGTQPKQAFIDLHEKMAAAWANTGIGPMYSFPGTSPEHIALAIVSAVTAPEDFYIPKLTIRGSDSS